MPYVSSTERVHLDPELEDVIRRVLLSPPDKRPGLVNYSISRIVAKSMEPLHGWSYASLSAALAIFSDAAAEMRRRLMDQHEDAAIEQNGDIPEYQHRE